ncbi:Metallo-dependent phosphatase-like protein [Schizophyllum commune]
MADLENGNPPPTQPPDIQNPDQEDMIRIMLATDNHIGYMERDPIRGQDSINTFKEILQLAVKHDVDFILLAGDLFHENKPSRECLYQVMALLREYTMGDKPVQVELLSDPNDGKADGYSFPAVNYEDPNLNVGIPVFSIHGNHDDPQGAGAEGALCALDVLSVSGLINYMGKFDLPLSEAAAAKDGIAVKPVLLRKGNTLLGLYGIGNVKDARMHFELRSNRVKMFMPRDKDSWFNILLLHQNRVKHGPQEFVPEGMFDDSVDLVVWGHEHDCRIIPEPVAGKNYYITQPGSSVATSLSEGETIPKHVAIVSIQGKEFKFDPIRLRTVRPFVTEEVVLSEIADEEDLDLTDQAQIHKYLKSRVDALIARAHEEWEARNAEAVEQGDDPLPSMLPLVRLRVETTGVSEMSNPVRFGQEFQGRIANPHDVLIFHRAKRMARNAKVAIEKPELSIDDPELTTSEKLEKVRVGTLVREFLAAQDIQLLGEMGMSDAIRMFVEKDQIHSIQEHVQAELKKMQQNMRIDNKLEKELDDSDIEELLHKAKENQEKEYEETYKQRKSTKGKGKAKAPSPTPAEESDDSMKMDIDLGTKGSDFDDDMESDPPPKKKAPARKAPAKKAATAKKAPARGGRGKKAATPDESDEAEVIDIDDVSGSDDDDEPPPPPKKKTNRAATLSQTGTKKAPAKKTAASSSKQTQLTFTPATTQRTSSRAAATRARGKIVIEDDSDD